MAVTFARIGVMFGKMRTSGRPEPHRNRKVPLAKKSEQQTEAGLPLYPKNRVLCRLGDSEFDDGLGGHLHLVCVLGLKPYVLSSFASAACQNRARRIHRSS